MLKIRDIGLKNFEIAFKIYVFRENLFLKLKFVFKTYNY